MKAIKILKLALVLSAFFALGACEEEQITVKNDGKQEQGMAD